MCGGRSGGGCVLVDGVAAEAEGGFLAQVQPLSEVEQLAEGGELAMQVQGSEQAAEFHGLLLAVGVAFPVEPVQFAGIEVDGVGEFCELAEVLLGCLGAEVGVEQQLVSPSQADEQVVGGELVLANDATLLLQAQGGVQVQAEVLPQGGCGGDGGGGLCGLALAGLPEGLACLFVLYVEQGAGGVLLGEAVAHGAFKGLHDGRQVRQGFADEHEAEAQGLAGLQATRVVGGGRLDDVGGGCLAGWMCGLRGWGKDLAVGAAFGQGAGVVVVVWQQCQAFEGMAEGSAQGGADVGGQVQRGIGTHGEDEAGDGQWGGGGCGQGFRFLSGR